MAGANRIQLTGHFQEPDRLEETIQVPGRSPVEAVLVGSTTFVRDAPAAAWRRTSGTGGGADPRAAFAVLVQASVVKRSGDVFVFSVPAQRAARLVAGTVPTGAATGSARLSGGRIIHLVIEVPTRTQAVSISIDYGSIGAAPAVTVPSGA
jgi:hypothetical protein